MISVAVSILVNGPTDGASTSGVNKNQLPTTNVFLPGFNELLNFFSQENVVLDDKIKSHEAALEKLKPTGNSLSSTEVTITAQN